MPEQVVIAGLSCGDVLEGLSDYLDGTLPEATVGRVEEHLRGCRWCAQFGGEFTTVVQGLRESLGAEPVDEGVSVRLGGRLDALFETAS